MLLVGLLGPLALVACATPRPVLPRRSSSSSRPPAAAAPRGPAGDPRLPLPPASAPASAPASQPVASVGLENAGALAPFYGKLRALRAGQIARLRVTHWGDSHVTSDVLTGELRSRLQAELGDGGPGFVLLGKPWRSYYHSQVKTGAERGWRAERLWMRYGRRRPQPRDDLFGLAGITVHSRRQTTAWLELRGPGRIGALDLYLLEQPGGGTIELHVGGQRVLRRATAGREKQAGFGLVQLPAGTRRVELRVSGGEVRLFGVDLASGQRGLVYDALGINGARAASLLQWNEAVMAHQLARLAPDLLVVAYGSNEVDSDTLSEEGLAREFDEVLQRLRRMVPGASCLVLGPPDRGRYRKESGWQIPESLALVSATQRRLARHRGCAFWDTRAAMGGAGSILVGLGSDPPLAQSDRVHLTAAGYRRLGEALHRALLAGAPALPAASPTETSAGRSESSP